MRFLVDENLPAEIAFLLEESGQDTVYVPRTELHGSADSVLVEFASRDRRIIVTKDVTLAMRRGHLTHGMVLVQVPEWFRKVEIIEAFERFMRHPRFGEVEGKLTFVGPRRVTARPLPDA